MPFDNSTDLVETPDLTKPSLIALSWVLRHKEAWPPGYRWDYSHLYSCAIGIYRRSWPLAGPLSGAIKRQQYENMFCHYAYRPVRDADVTPEMVADRIDAYLASHR
jgi:hypothetical protein